MRLRPDPAVFRSRLREGERVCDGTDMIAFIIRRLLGSITVMLTVAFIAFALFNFVGDPINNMVGQDTTLQDREKLRQSLGLNDPFPLQFARSVARAVQGNFAL